MLDTATRPKIATSVDAVFEQTNPFGRYQWLVSLVYIFAFCPLDINNFFMGYGGMKPKWTCSVPEAYNGTAVDPSKPTDSCAIFEKCPRENLTFISEFHSIVSEWSLVCDQDYLMSLITSIQMVGLLLGALMIGPVTDLYGRKWVFIVILSLEMTLGALSGLSTSAVMFAFFRFCIGWCTGAEVVVGWVFTAESTTNRYRFLVRVVAAVSLPLWNQVFIAYLTRGWKWYSIVGNLEGLPLLPIIAYFTYESPRWLAQKGRTEQAKEILEKIARINRTEHLLPENIDLETEATENGRKKGYYIWDLFRSRRLAVYTVGSLGTWFAVSLAHYGMFFDIGNLPTDVYLNGAVLAAVNMLIIPLAAYDVYNVKVNRKYVMVASFVFTAICNVAVVLCQTVIPTGAVTDVVLSLTSIVGQMSTEITIAVAYVYAIELFPTLLRSNAMALASCSARVAAVIAPQLLYAGKTWGPLPYVIFAVISVIGAGIDALFLPNTKNMQLPETYEQSNKLQSDADFSERSEVTSEASCSSRELF